MRFTSSGSRPVSIDGAPAAVDALHGFTGLKTLASGTHTFAVTATDASGNSPWSA